MVGGGQFLDGLGDDAFANHALERRARDILDDLLGGQRLREIVVVYGLLRRAVEPVPHLETPFLHAMPSVVDHHGIFEENASAKCADGVPVVKVHGTLSIAVGSVDREVAAPVLGLVVVGFRLLAADIALCELVLLPVEFKAIEEVPVGHQPGPPVELPVVFDRCGHRLLVQQTVLNHLTRVESLPGTRCAGQLLVHPLGVGLGRARKKLGSTVTEHGLQAFALPFRNVGPLTLGKFLRQCLDLLRRRHHRSGSAARLLLLKARRYFGHRLDLDGLRLDLLSFGVRFKAHHKAWSLDEDAARACRRRPFVAAAPVGGVVGLPFPDKKTIALHHPQTLGKTLAVFRLRERGGHIKPAFGVFCGDLGRAELLWKAILGLILRPILRPVARPVDEGVECRPCGGVRLPRTSQQPGHGVPGRRRLHPGVSEE